MIITRLLPAVVVALLGLSASAQHRVEPCELIKYENKNQVDARRLSVSKVSGRVAVEVGELGASAIEAGLVSGACVVLFTEREHQLVANATADREGRFTFGAVPEGDYRLIVRADPLCLANVLLRVVTSKRGGARKRQVVVHMRAAGIDTCSYADYK
jgi:hypothetical protein